MSIFEKYFDIMVISYINHRDPVYRKVLKDKLEINNYYLNKVYYTEDEIINYKEYKAVKTNNGEILCGNIDTTNKNGYDNDKFLPGIINVSYNYITDTLFIDNVEKIPQSVLQKIKDYLKYIVFLRE